VPASSSSETSEFGDKEEVPKCQEVTRGKQPVGKEPAKKKRKVSPPPPPPRKAGGINIREPSAR